MPPPIECAVAVNLVIPRVERVEKDLDNLHVAIRDTKALVAQHELAHRDASERMAKLERAFESAASVQHADNQWMHAQIEGLQSGVRVMCEKVERIDHNVGRIDQLRDDLRDLFVESAKAHDERARKIAEDIETRKKETDETLKKHKSVMVVGMTIAYSLAGLVVVLAGLHMVASGESVVTSITKILQWVSP